MRTSRQKILSLHQGYTLLELLVVISIVITLVGVVAPALRFSRPTSGALIELKGALDRARSEAIRNRTDAFVAFTDSLPNYEGTQSTDAMRYRAYAIFLREPTQTDPVLRYNADIHTCPLKMIANWKSLPDGTLFALGEDIETLADAERIFTLLDAGDPEESGEFRSSSYRSFPLKIDGQPYDGPLPCIAFNREGVVRLPDWSEAQSLHLGIVSGSVVDGNRVITAFISEVGNSENKVPLVDLLTITQSTGRVREVGISTQANDDN